jgi:hypothetical protein
MTEAKKKAGKKGGLKRAAAMTPEELKARAQRGAAARWGKPLIALNKGSFLEKLGIDVDCYVLNDATRTPVISQTGMALAIGLVGRGNALPRFLSSQAMVEAVGAELGDKFKNPIKFQWGSGGAEQPPTEVHGYDAAMLIDLCRAIVQADADGNLKPQQRKLATNAAIVIGASAKSGIRDLVYALAGYNQTADQVIQAFKVYVHEEAKKYEPEFPEALYDQWFRLYEIPVHPGRGWPWQFKHLTVRHVYYPLAKSNGQILELLRALKAQGGDQKTKLFQFLNKVGARALRIHIGRLLEMSETSSDRTEYENKVANRFGGQQELDLVVPPAPAPQIAEQAS